MPLIIPANTLSDAGYDVANSCRFNRPDSPRLVIANPTAGTRTKGTFSTWFKRCSLGTAQYLFSTWNNATSGYSSALISFQTDNRINISNFVASGASGGSTLITERMFRDVSAWYHLCINWDTTDSETDRYKIYVNGTRETVFNGTPAYPTSSQDLFFNIGGTANPQHIGYQSTGSDTHYFDGYLAETVHIEGNDLAASSFGEFDEDSPTIWKPKKVSGLTFGDEGFYLDYEDSDNLGDDESGNTNDFAEANLAAVDQCTDSPTNNFATFNSIHTEGTATHDPNFSEGNVAVTFDDADDSTLSTIGVTAGKWYCEFKITNEATGKATVGVGNESSNLVINPGSNNIGGHGGDYGYYANGEKAINGASLASYGDTFTDDDIISIALDLENGAIWFAKNGTWQDSATEGEIEAGTTTNAAATSLSGTFFIGCCNSASGTTGDAFSVNFGNPSYANSSSVSDGNGYGAFEYSVPDGFLALCTKNLGSTGG
jgi:hypothetical protein